MSESLAERGKQFAAMIAEAAPGVLFEANLVPLNASGKLRVRYNWLYSALNCDPEDDSDFLWSVEKMSNGRVALSPTAHYAGKHLYASVRPDDSYFVQVQAPFSADWITRAQADELVTMTARDLMYVSFTGLNNAFLAVQKKQDDHDGYRAFRIRSNAQDLGKSSSWFPGIVNAVQPAFASFVDVRPTAQQVEGVMQHAGFLSTAQDAVTIAAQLAC